RFPVVAVWAGPGQVLEDRQSAERNGMDVVDLEAADLTQVGRPAVLATPVRSTSDLGPQGFVRTAHGESKRSGSFERNRGNAAIASSFSAARMRQTSTRAAYSAASAGERASLLRLSSRRRSSNAGESGLSATRCRAETHSFSVPIVSWSAVRTADTARPSAS